jgi:hypothetical protein
MITTKQLFGIIVNGYDLDQVLQQEIKNTGSDIPVFRKEGLSLKIFFSCNNNECIIRLEITVANEKYLDYIIHKILICFSDEKAA